MSGIANLFNIPDNQPTLDEWSFALQANLRDINRVIFERAKIVIPEYQLDPFNIHDPNAQLLQLQVWMNDINFELGIAGFDYVDVNLADKGELTSWIFLLSQNIRTATDQLGI